MWCSGLRVAGCQGPGWGEPGASLGQYSQLLCLLQLCLACVQRHANGPRDANGMPALKMRCAAGPITLPPAAIRPPESFSSRTEQRASQAATSSSVAAGAGSASAAAAGCSGLASSSDAAAAAPASTPRCSGLCCCCCCSWSRVFLVPVTSWGCHAGGAAVEPPSLLAPLLLGALSAGCGIAAAAWMTSLL